ncbi:MAG TPA: thioredoxin [Bacillota bacterium]|jgi:thioredoxin 1
MANVFSVTDNDFELEVLKANTPVLVDFWAAWCGPCKMVAPAVEAMAEEFEGKLKVCKMNVDENPKTPADYGIMGIPTLIVFKGGEVNQKIVGAVPKEALKARIAPAIG